MIETKETAHRAPTPLPPNRDAANWAQPVDRLSAAGVAGAKDDAVTGKRVSGPLQGFGQLWQKSFTVRLDGVDMTPQAVVAIWKEHFPTFWPKGQRFYAPLSGIAPGEVALLELATAARGPREAVDRRPRPVRGRRVVHVHDPRRPYAVGVDHLLRPTRRRRDDRPGAGARAAVRPVRRDWPTCSAATARTTGSGRRPCATSRRTSAWPTRRSRRRSPASTGTGSGDTGGTSATARRSGPRGGP